jgi:hypothetical protein
MPTLEQRLDRLEAAHRALHARHEGLMIVCRVMLPFIDAPQAVKQKMMLLAYDALTQHMEKTGCDDEFQQVAREAIDEIANTVLVDSKLDA